MWFDAMVEGRARYDEMIKQAEQERRARKIRQQRPSRFKHSWELVLTRLGSWMVEWGTLLQVRQQPTPVAVPVRKTRI